jgi:ATP-dependent helicase/nuclease subunit A
MDPERERFEAVVRAGLEALPDGAERLAIVTGLECNALVEAGAGTGKTHLTVDRIRYGIATGAWDLADIAAITFTEKAAGELRERVRRMLRRTASEFGGQIRKRARMGLEQIEYASISTIHSFCAQILREFALEAGLDPGFGVADAPTARLIREQAWERWLESEMGAQGSGLAAILKRGTGLERVREAAFKLCDERDATVAATAEAPAMDAVRAEVLFVVERLAPVAQRLRASRSRAGIGLKELALGLAGKADELGSMDEEDLADWLVLGLWFSETQSASSKRDLTKMPAGLKPPELRILQECHDGMKALQVRLASSMAGGAANALRSFVDAYKARLAEEGLLDFAGLLLGARDLLRDRPDVREKLKERCRALFVDEFQDTDPLQAEVVFFLAEAVGGAAGRWDQARPESGRLFIVGDPKQSIYRFRRADLGMYRTASGRFAEGERHVIRTNFRSSRRLLDAFDAIFEPVMADGAAGAPHEALRPAPNAPEGGRDALLLLPTDEHAALPADEGRRAQAQALARLLAGPRLASWRLRERRIEDGREREIERPCTWGDVAVLMRKLTNVGVLEEAFEQWGVPFRVLGGRSFYRQQEIQYAVTMLRAVDSPLDSVAVVGALRSPFFGISDDELTLWHAAGRGWNYTAETAGEDAGRVAAAMARLRAWHAARLEGPAVALAERVMRETAFYELNLARPQGERRVSNLAKLMDELRVYEQSGRLTFHGIVEELTRLALGPRAEDEEESVTSEPGEPVVRVLTIHSAKGLDFPVVVVPFLNDTPGGPGGDPAVVVKRGRSPVAEVHFTTGMDTAGYAGALELEKGEEEQERRRLLYVALTRAKAGLVLPWGWRWARAGHEGPGRKNPGSFEDILAGPLEALRAGNPPWLEELNEAELPEPPRPPAGTRPRLDPETALAGRAELESHLAALRETLGREEVRSPSQAGAEPAPAQGAGARGRSVGDLYHRVMEAVPLDAGDEDVARLCASIAAGQGLAGDEALVREVAELVDRTLASDLWTRVRAAARIERECPITAPLGEMTLVDGVMDLVFWEGGRPVVVDYKTDHVAPGQCAERARVYAEQGALYGEAVEAVLGAAPEVLLYFVRADRAEPLPVSRR